MRDQDPVTENGSTADARRQPRRWHAARAGFRAAVGVSIVSVVMGGAAFAASNLHQQYGAPHIQADTRAWAGRAATYSLDACVRCHGDVSAARDTGAHADLICEACHVPSVAHPGSVQGVFAHLPVPGSSICVTCHGTTPGREPGFPQVDPSRHYRGAACLRCHDPHTAAASKPPEVTHPLANLPACTTCHAAHGLAALPADHEPAADTVCLSCHGPRANSR